MRELTNAEYRLLDWLDRAIGHEISVRSLHRSTKAMAYRMNIKGYLHKKAFKRGIIRANQFGRRHWLAHKLQVL